MVRIVRIVRIGETKAYVKKKSTRTNQSKLGENDVDF